MRDDIESMKGVPWEVVPGQAGTEVKTQVFMPQSLDVRTPDGKTEEKVRQVRRMILQRKDFKQVWTNNQL